MSTNNGYNIPLGRPYIKTDVVLSEIKKVLDSRWTSGGPKITEFENEIKKYNDDSIGRYIAVSNGTVALEMALKLINGGNTYHNSQKNEVIVPSWSWVASGFAVSLVGAKPVWCDVNRFGVPDVDTIKEKITLRTAAIIVVHQMGIPCDMDKINELAKKYNIPVIEDGACALGSEYKGKKLGNMEYSNNIFTYSFQARKVLSTGEGGMIVVSNEEQEEKLRSMRAFSTNVTPLKRDTSNHIIKEFFSTYSGNYKLSDITAAVGIAHLTYVDEEIELREIAGKYYDEKILQLNDDGYNIYPGNLIPSYCTRYNWQNYHIVLGISYNRDKIINKLKSIGIGCKWDIQAINIEPAYNNFQYNLPLTMMFHNNGMWLPFFAEITREQQNIVIEQLKGILNEFK